MLGELGVVCKQYILINSLREYSTESSRIVGLVGRWVFNGLRMGFGWLVGRLVGVVFLFVLA